MSNTRHTTILTAIKHRHLDQFWGVLYSDGQSHTEGWVSFPNASLYHDGLQNPQDIIHESSPAHDELLLNGEIVTVSVVRELL